MSDKFWLSLDQAENPAEYKKNIPGEFTSSPIRVGNENDSLGRRDFMKIMGASALMASMAGCSRRPVQKIVPYVNNPEEIIPGQPNFYASANPQTGHGFIVKTREGRPIKIDGNVDHPLNGGGIHTREQAIVHDLYDPDRLRAPMIDGHEVEWKEFDEQVGKALQASRGATYVLTGTVISPTLRAMIEKNGFKHTMVDAIPMDDVLDGQAQSYGTRQFPRYRFDKADYIVSIDADFMDDWGSTVEYQSGFYGKRRLLDNNTSMNQLVAFESSMRLTGQNADKRVKIHPADQLQISLGLANEVARLAGRSVEDLSAYTPAAVAQRTGVAEEIIKEVAKNLVAHKGKGLVIASGKGTNALALQNVVNFINSTLENEGETVDGTAFPSYQFQGSYAEFDKLLNAIRSGAVKTLIVAGINPAYVFADSLKVKEALQKVPNLIYVTQHSDETSALAKYVAAESHQLESWGDVNPQKELYSIVQPTIQPLWKTKSMLDMMVDWSEAATGNKGPENSYEAVLTTWRQIHAKFGGGKSFQDWWDASLMGGVVSSSGRGGKATSRAYRMDALRSALAVAKAAPQKGGDGEFTLVVTVPMAMGDGSQSNNALLQELPDPVSKNTWGNYLAVSPEDAKKNGWVDGDFVTVKNDATSVELALYRQAGMTPGVVSAHMGYGRKFHGRNGNDVGVSLANFTAASGSAPNLAVTGIRIAKTGRNEKIACTQEHNALEGREIVFDTTLEEFKEDPRSGIVREFPNPPSIWSGFEYKGYKWGMVVDLNSCSGCSACVVACSVENNVPSVGRDQVAKARAMQWIRIDRYYTGDTTNPETLTQPMLCQHCDNAPCETVCPVLATVHSDEGINQMAYNRCVGTKYCSNNCPYKVRRFNWFENNQSLNGELEHPIPLKMNPEVTMRSRGVMEKCTFCIQRIELGKHSAKAKGRRVTDNDIRTACQEACPTNAIVFGDVNNPESRVSQLLKNPRGFTTLEELNTRPAVTYLTKVRNRPAGKKEEAEGHEAHSEHQG